MPDAEPGSTDHRVEPLDEAGPLDDGLPDDTGPLGEPAQRQLTIEEVAHLAGMTTRNVRAYQQRRLLPPARRRGRRLSFGWEHVSRLRVIRDLHAKGIPLRVIEGLVSQGTVEAELTRLAQERAPDHTRVRVPLAAEAIEDLTRDNPGLLHDLCESGVVHLRDGQLVANSAGLGVSSALLARGVDLRTICRLVVLSSRAAHAAADELVAELHRDPQVAEEEIDLAVQLAVISFSNVLLDAIAAGADTRWHACTDPRRQAGTDPRRQAGTDTAAGGPESVVLDARDRPRVLPRQTGEVRVIEGG